MFQVLYQFLLSLVKYHDTYMADIHMAIILWCIKPIGHVRCVAVVKKCFVRFFWPINPISHLCHNATDMRINQQPSLFCISCLWLLATIYPVANCHTTETSSSTRRVYRQKENRLAFIRWTAPDQQQPEQIAIGIRSINK